MFRHLSFCLLLLCLGGIALATFEYVDPPITDPLLFGFIKRDRYLPKGDLIRRVELYSPVQKLLAEDRRAYATILCLSGVALISAVGLFFGTTNRSERIEPHAPPNGGAPAPVTNRIAPGGPPSVS
jgi:hypothetical protein